jgi:signal transduction histidine kinase
MGQIVQELLTLSRIESGQVPLRLQPTLVSDLILPPSERLLPAAQRKSIELIIDLPLALPPVLVDVDQVEQVMRNLLHNAIKYTREGGSIVVSAVRQGDRVELAVRDTGIGIPEHDNPRIFERF